MTVKVNLGKNHEDEFSRGLSELSGFALKTADFSILDNSQSKGETDTVIRIRASNKSGLVTGEIERKYTRINLVDVIKKETDDERIHIWGDTSDDSEENGWVKTKGLVFDTLTTNFKIALDKNNHLEIIKVDDKLYVDVNNLSLTGRCEIYHASETVKTSLDLYLKPNITLSVYKDILHEIPVDAVSGDELMKDIAGDNPNVDLSGCTLELRSSTMVRVHVPINHPKHIYGYKDISYTRALTGTRIASIYRGEVSSGPLITPFFYNKPFGAIKSEDYPDVIRALNEQYQLALATDGAIHLSFRTNVPDGSTDVNFFMGVVEGQYLFDSDNVILRWMKSKTELNDLFPEERIEMYDGVM